MPLRASSGACNPTGLYVGHTGGALYDSKLSPFPLFSSLFRKQIDHELPLGSKNAYSLVRVIDKNTHFEDFGKFAKGSIITAFISTHSLHIFFFTLSSCSMASHSFEMTLESLCFLALIYVQFEHLYPHRSNLRMYLYTYL